MRLYLFLTIYIISRYVHSCFIIHTKLYVFSLALPAAPPACPLDPEAAECLPPSVECTSKFKEDALVLTDPPYVST